MDNVENVRLAPEATSEPESSKPAKRSKVVSLEDAQAEIDRLQAQLAAKRQEVAVTRLTSGQLGDNIASKLNGHILTLTIDLSRRLHRSKAGKSDIVASTGGNMSLGNGLFLGINCYRK